MSLMEEASQPKQPEPSAATDPSAEEILKIQLDEAQKKYLYLYAEFENFKKRQEKEYGEIRKYASESLIYELLGVVDNLELALNHTPGSDLNSLAQGLKMVLKLFSAALEKHGVKRVETIGRPFDPNFHEAVGQEILEGKEEGVVLKEQSSGYTLHGRLLRPARVIVNKRA